MSSVSVVSTFSGVPEFIRAMNTWHEKMTDDKVFSIFCNATDKPVTIPIAIISDYVAEGNDAIKMVTLLPDSGIFIREWESPSKHPEQIAS